MCRFETKWLSQRENLAALADLPGQWNDGYIVAARRGSLCSTWIRARARHTRAGKQAYNGHVGRLHLLPPLFLFSQFGDVERCALRPRNVTQMAGVQFRSR
jgi:hypothetical protein